MPNSSNQKILFVISTYFQYQTYIQTRSLQDIKDRLVFLISPKLAKMDFDVPVDRLFIYSYPDYKDIFHRHIFNINSWINRHNNNAFWVRTLLFKPRQRRVYGILSLPGLSRVIKWIFVKRGQDRNLLEIIKKIDPAIILLPSHAFEGRTVEIIRIAKTMKIPSFMIIDNWDTVANKTVFTIMPDYLGVWSQQQVEHAIKIRNMPKDRIFIIGTPKFIDHLDPEKRKQPSPYPFKYALFVGMSEYFDELGALKRLDEAMEKRNIDDLKIVYRPTATQHTRNCSDVFFEYDYKHVVIDTPAKVYYKRSVSWDISKESFNPIYFPEFEYYPKLLANMEFMIVAQSTMLLEAALFDKKTYLLAYDDGFHSFGPHWIFGNGLHLVGIDHLKNVRMIHNIEDLDKIFDPGDPLKENVEPIDIDYFVSKEATANYAANLKKTVDTILNNWSKT